jgi:microcystin-dependent protein
MTETYRFYSGSTGDTRSYTAADWAAFFRSLFSTGVSHGTLGALAVTQHSSGDRSVDVATGSAWVYGYMVTNDASANVAVAANSSGNPRIDRIILRNTVATGITIEVLQGTPAASPAAPALTQNSTTYEISLAQVYLANGYTQILTANITDERTYSTVARVVGTQVYANGTMDMGSQKITNAAAASGTGTGLTKGDVDAYATNFYPLPPGAVVFFGEASVPSGFLACNGAAVSRTTYAALFSVIGVGFGVGDGSTTFNVPSMSSRIIIGHSGSGDYYYVGSTGGASTVTLVTAELPSHTHLIQYASGDLKFGSYSGSSQTVGAGGTGTSGSTGSGGAHDNMPPHIILNWGIKT